MGHGNNKETQGENHTCQAESATDSTQEIPKGVYDGSVDLARVG